MHDSPKAGRILIVDDNSSNLRLLGTALRSAGYQVMPATSGPQALTMLESMLPDLILLDIMMPEMDGFELCERLKNSAETQALPIIFLTAKTEINDIIKGFEFGAVDYIVKPFNLQEVLVRVKTHLELKFSKEFVQKQRNEYKELLHILCHDLNNPLWSIFLVLENAKWDPNFLVSKRTAMNSAIKNSLDTIELVRQIRSLDEAEFTLSLSAIPLYKVLAESLSMFEQQLLEKHIHLNLKVAEEIQVVAERSSFINSVLNNLLSNAIKFSYPDSQIVIEASTRDEQTLLSIQDFGIGIPDKLLLMLFDVSKKTSRTGTLGESGTGFGMPLVKKFMLKYGGDIEIHSEEEQPSTSAHGTLVQLRFLNHLK
ncbi:hybrid sensor histidine kinase/response regulator [Deltaproteobacteria bacterium TL4]